MLRSDPHPVRAFTFGLAVSLAIPFATVSPQQPPPIEPGVRVRILAAPTADGRYGRFVGTVARLDSDSLDLLTNESSPVVVSLTSVLRLEVHRGRRGHPWQGAFFGFITGATLGIFIGPSMLGQYESEDLNRVVAAGGLGFLGFFLGLGIGAVYKTDRWEEVPLDQLRVSVAPQPDGRFWIGLSVSF